MNSPNLADWVISLGLPIISKLVSGIVSWTTRPKFKLTPNIDWSGEGEYYLRLQIQNAGRKTAKNCIGRLIEIRDDQGSVDLPQLNFCWERQNQLNPPHPVDIATIPFAMHLDIAKHSVNDNEIKLRVDGENQSPKYGHYDATFRHLILPAKTYYIRVAIFGENASQKEQWFVLGWSGTTYSIKATKPPKNTRNRSL